MDSIEIMAHAGLADSRCAVRRLVTAPQGETTLQSASKNKYSRRWPFEYHVIMDLVESSRSSIIWTVERVA
jgi:hypothetical protein